MSYERPTGDIVSDLRMALKFRARGIDMNIAVTQYLMDAAARLDELSAEVVALREQRGACEVCGSNDPADRRRMPDGAAKRLFPDHPETHTSLCYWDEFHAPKAAFSSLNEIITEQDAEIAALREQLAEADRIIKLNFSEASKHYARATRLDAELAALRERCRQAEECVKAAQNLVMDWCIDRNTPPYFVAEAKGEAELCAALGAWNAAYPSGAAAVSRPVEPKTEGTQ